MKCIPMTLSGRLVTAPSLVMEIEEVLEARMVSGGVISSSCLNRAYFAARFSRIASITRSPAAASATLVD